MVKILLSPDPTCNPIMGVTPVYDLLQGTPHKVQDQRIERQSMRFVFQVTLSLWLVVVNSLRGVLLRCIRH